MTEHILRYEDFAKFLNENDVLVCGNDHLGHGKSITSKKNLGYFCKEKGHFILVDDLNTMHNTIAEEYPGVPYFLLGHSMGSFAAREYIMRYGQGLSGAIIMGTGQNPQALLGFAKLLCKIIKTFKGWHHRSNTISNIAFGKYNKKTDSITPFDWLTRDKNSVQKYIDDPLCGYTFTLNGFYNLFDMISYIEKDQNIAKIDKELPILLISGQEDPVGLYGKAVHQIYNIYKNTGIKNTQKKLYPDNRHEILNELDKNQVYTDILE